MILRKTTLGAVGLTLALVPALLPVFSDRYLLCILVAAAVAGGGVTILILLAALKQSRSSMRMLLDNAVQGFLSFGPDGIVDEECSRPVEAIFGTKAPGHHVAALFGRAHEKEMEWDRYLRTLFSETMEFSDLARLMPDQFELNGRAIKAEYRDLRDEAGKRVKVMMVVTDVTEIRALELKGERERERNLCLVKIVGHKNEFLEILSMTNALGFEQRDANEFKRGLHTLKGGFAFLECRPLADLCHYWENELSKDESRAAMARAARELVAAAEKFTAENERVLGISKIPERTIAVSVSAVENAIKKAHDYDAPHPVIRSIESLRERPLAEVLGWLSDVFEKTAGLTGKRAAPLRFLPSETICPDDYKDLFQSLVHVARNAADHGIEDPDERVARGKAPEGNLVCQLQSEGNSFVLTFEDDGRGADLDRIAVEARKRGLPVPATAEERLDLLFHASFTTKTEITETSGRGVGLDALRCEARRLGGDVKAESFPGRGMRFTVRFAKIIPNSETSPSLMVA